MSRNKAPVVQTGTKKIGAVELNNKNATHDNKFFGGHILEGSQIATLNIVGVQVQKVQIIKLLEKYSGCSLSFLIEQMCKSYGYRINDMESLIWQMAYVDHSICLTDSRRAD